MRVFTLFVGLLFASLALAEVTSKAVDYEDDGTALRGTLYWDAAVTEKRPGIVLYPEWWGLNEYAHSRAKMLADEGYVVFAADM